MKRIFFKQGCKNKAIFQICEERTMFLSGGAFVSNGGIDF